MGKYDYNLVVVGAGSAGLVSSYIAASAKAKVALVEKHKMGGDCLNTGCVPSKALIRTAAFLRDCKRAEHLGIRNVSFEFDFAEVMQRVQRVINAIEPHDSVERYTGLGVDCFQGEAKIISEHEVRVGETTLSARSIGICAGAAPFIPPIEGIETVDYKTSDTIWDIRTQPKKMIVIGAGPIGCELAQCFAYLGTEVTQIEGGDRIMSREDADAAAVVTDAMGSAGVKILHNTRAIAVEKSADGGARLICEEDGEKKQIPFDLILFAAGRAPNGGKVPGLAEVGVEINRRGAIEVNEYLQTTVPNIFACGDITGTYQFTHTAGHAAYYLAMNALMPIKQKVNWSIVPWCTFTHPEVARVGLNEQEAERDGVAFETVKYPIDDLDRAIADEEAVGFVKLLTKPSSGEILGVTIVGAHAGDLICEYVLAMRKKMPVKEILRTIHIYPTLSEANRFAAGLWQKSNLNRNLIKISDRINQWYRG